MTGANAGNGNGFTWSSFENLVDTGTGTFNVNTGGSVSGTVNGGANGTVSYAGNAGPVSFNLAGGASTGMASWSNIKTVTGSGASDTISGSAQAYSLTAANAGNNGTVSWTSFENLTDSGAGVFNFGAGSSVAGDL
jgi:hypothetical protein